MIWSALLTLLKAMRAVVVAILPTWTPVDLSGYTDELTANAGGVFGLLAWADWYAPITEFLQLVLVVSGIFVTALLYKGVMFVLRTFHIAG